MSAIFVYVTASSDAEAQKIASTLIIERLVACANIIPGMRSLYRWQDKIEQRKEVVLILKTQAQLFSAVEALIKSLHSDKTPCIVSLPVDTGNADFLKWIEAETT